MSFQKRHRSLKLHQVRCKNTFSKHCASTICQYVLSFNILWHLQKHGGTKCVELTGHKTGQWIWLSVLSYCVEQSLLQNLRYERTLFFQYTISSFKVKREIFLRVKFSENCRIVLLVWEPICIFLLIMMDLQDFWKRRN